MSFLQTYLNGLIDASEEKLTSVHQSIMAIFYIGSAVLISSSLGFAIHFFRLAGDIQKYGQYPAPGMKVFRDLEIKSGAAARVYRFSFLFTGCLILVMGILIPLVFFLLFSTME